MHWFFIICVSATLNLMVFMLSAQSEMFIFPTEGQGADQQELDELRAISGPKTKQALIPISLLKPQPLPRAGGEAAVFSEARWAARLGAIGGAIAGDAGKGAAIGAAVGGGAGAIRNRRNRIESDDRRQQAAAQQQQSGQTFNRAYGVCLEAKGYKVG